MSYELDEYKARVKRVAIDVAREQGWCNEGLNEALTTLDIDPVTTRYRVVASVVLEFTVEVGDEFDHSAGPAAVHEFMYGELNGSVRSVHVDAYGSEWEFDTDCTGTTIDTVEPIS